jgi:O-antigen ligase
MTAPVAQSGTLAVAPPAATDSGLPRLGKTLLFGSILAQFSRLPELVVLIIGFFPPLVVTGSGILATFITIFTGQARLTRSGLLWIFFTVWFCMATAFSTWPGGSTQTFIKFWLPSIILNVAVTSLIQTRKDLKTVLYLTALSSVIVAFAGLKMGRDMGEDRLGVEGASTLSNGNDMCLFLLAGLPCLVMIAELRKGVWRVLALASVPFVVYIVILTGSRAAALDLVVLWLLWFWRAAPIHKLKHLIILSAGIISVVSFAPTASLTRYATMLPFVSLAPTSERMAEQAAAAEGSTELRQKLVSQSLDLTWRHPLFGVGPGVYQSAAAKDSAEKGEKAIWFVSHNSYTQISSECGIPGFVLYMAAVLVALNSLRRGLKVVSRTPELNETRTLGFYLLMVTLGNMVLSMFASVAYMPYFIIFAGLGDAYLPIATNDLSRLAERMAPARPNEFPRQVRRHLRRP